VLMSFDRIGRLRWSMQAGTRSVQNPALDGKALYTSTRDGLALALDKDTGREIWQTRVSASLPGDTYSPTAFEDFVIYPAGDVEPYGSPDVVCLNKKDGSIRWRYSVGDKYGGATGEIAKNGVGPKYTTVNLTPCYWNRSIIFNDVSGAMYRLSIDDGSEIWYVPGDDKDMYTLGGSCCGPNGKAYLGFSTAPGQGAIEVFDLATGAKHWRQSVQMEVHSAPAVGMVQGRLMAVVGIGSPSGGALPPLKTWPLRYSVPWALGWRPDVRFPGVVEARDAETGELVWSFEPPPWREMACAGSTWEQSCLPDLWSGPTIDAAGTVWINWSAGGVLYGLRDANGDGRVSIDDPAETTRYDCGSAATGPPALGRGMVATATCRRVVAFG